MYKVENRDQHIVVESYKADKYCFGVKACFEDNLPKSIVRLRFPIRLLLVLQVLAFIFLYFNQTWPTEVDMIEADKYHKDKKLKKKTLPWGTSDYQVGACSDPRGFIFQ